MRAVPWPRSRRSVVVPAAAAARPPTSSHASCRSYPRSRDLVPFSRSVTVFLAALPLLAGATRLGAQQDTSARAGVPQPVDTLARRAPDSDSVPGGPGLRPRASRRDTLQLPRPTALG